MIVGPSKKFEFKLPIIETKEDEVVVRKQPRIVDTDWIRMSLMTEIDEYEKEFVKHMYKSGVMGDTMSSTIGDHLTLNPPYGLGPWADVHYKGRIVDNDVYLPERRVVHTGAGRRWYEMFQVNSKPRTLIMESGVPHFQSIFSFWTQSVNYAQSIKAVEARSPIFYYMGYGMGARTAFLAFPVLTVAYYLLTSAYKATIGLPDPRYYTFKSNMHVYWGTVNNIMNTIAANKGVISLIEKHPGSDDDRVGVPIEVDKGDLKELNKLMPYLFKTTGYFDVMGLAGRYQRMLNKQLKTEIKLMKKGTLSSYMDLSSNVDPFKGGVKFDDVPEYAKFVESVEKLQAFKAEKRRIEAEKPPTTSANVNPDDYKKVDSDGRMKLLPHMIDDWFKTMRSYRSAAIQDGAGEVAFQIEYLGSHSITFNNSVKDIPLKSVVNNVGGGFKDIRFSASDFNVFGDVVDSVVNAGKDVAMGFLDGVSFGLTNVIQALTGGGYISFPKMWDDSSTSFDNHTFKIIASGPYGNPISTMIDQDIIVSSLLAFMAPMSIGRNAYTSPPLVKAFIQGMLNIDFGMVTSGTITAGTSNLGYTTDGSPLGVEITFSITDFSSIVTAPVNVGIGWSEDEYQTMSRYLKVLAGTSYSYNKFISKKVLLNIAKKVSGVESFLSPAGWGIRLSDNLLSKIESAIVPDLSGVSLFTN